MEEGVPIDVLWFSISRNPTDPEHALGNINYGRVIILINRGDHFQAGLIIRKGSFEEIKTGGLEEFRRIVRQIAPYLGDRVNEITRWDQVKLLSVQINRLKQWHVPGMLLIGDAAHAMSPAGGVGINLAVQDAIATANLLSDRIRNRRVTDTDLVRVQQRREFPTQVTQRLQVFAHKGMEKIFENPGPAHAPWQLKVAVNIPGMQHLVARTIGMGVRPEHVRDAKTRPAPERSSAKRLAFGIALMTAGIVIAARIWKTR
jgi:2-polyprenyl-6-methoxyphenol hydroxylase-like FAD-dependent oxidoreductase